MLNTTQDAVIKALRQLEQRLEAREERQRAELAVTRAHLSEIREILATVLK